MRNWDTRDESGTDSGCEWKKDWSDVQRVCAHLDIPVRMVRLLFAQYFFLLITTVLGRSFKRILDQSIRTLPSSMGIRRYTES